jgi:hypothetical protein
LVLAERCKLSIRAPLREECERERSVEEGRGGLVRLAAYRHITVRIDLAPIAIPFRTPIVLLRDIVPSLSMPTEEKDLEHRVAIALIVEAPEILSKVRPPLLRRI